ncbi:protein kinase domain-containing protein [Piscirickettsia salmonis]|uniref:protein kinase domain-containing protein n=1 Tax=Piscirickettsia salmonis TaxID=1238 RepID=UPI0007C8BC65|nr:Protein kinase domain protein [Piscirickettsiaceae bacterium NZ-RLO1]
MPKLHWDSAQQESKEWEIAKRNLDQSFDGVKLRRSRDLKPLYYTDSKYKGQPLRHSFMRISGKIYAFAGKGELLGQGTFGKVKLVENEQGDLYAMKVIPLEQVKEQELEVLEDLSLLKGHVRRVTFVENEKEKIKEKKQYILLDYLGDSLTKVKLHSDQEKLGVGIQIIDAVHQLHSGVASRSGSRVYHNDIKPENIVIDERGKASLIDFGTSDSGYVIGGTPPLRAKECKARGE